MLKNKLKSNLSLIFITAILAGNFFIFPLFSSANTTKSETITLEEYIAYYYNRYSAHLDDIGMKFKTPAYAVPEYRTPETPREILSLATYYKYRAIDGEKRARTIIRTAIHNANYLLNEQNTKNQSFSDAWTQMAIISLIDQIPLLFTDEEADQFYDNIIYRIHDGILAPDTSNRAALGAVYWQQIVNQLYAKEKIDEEQKKEFNVLIKQKIDNVYENDVDEAGWYWEDHHTRFSPHYHMITAFAFMSYGQIMGDFNYLLKAHDMVSNLRAITYSNGMIEASFGNRPVGLGAQFYLGAGLLNYKFHFEDYSTYLTYAMSSKFFSDPEYPNRLEYHSTISGSDPEFHDDISFSNLAELALLTPPLDELKYTPTYTMKDIPVNYKKGDVEIFNRGTSINLNGFEANQDATGDYTVWSKKRQVLGVITDIESYGHARPEPGEETDKINAFKLELKNKIGSLSRISAEDLQVLARAYIYGGYNMDEIVDTIKNGPRAVHPFIPALSWRSSAPYQTYLNSK